MIKFYVILAVAESDVLVTQSSDVILWWSSKEGWGDLVDASVYSEIDKESFRLPIAGEWVELPNCLWEQFQAHTYEADAKASATADDIVF